MTTNRGFICGGPRIYEYKGWMFEYGYGGPWSLKKDGSLRKRAGRAFYKMFQEWYDLGKDDREQYRVGGGYHRIGGIDANG